MPMTIYHGSNVEVREPKILPPDRELDFGNGFYTTTNLDQAIAFARRVTRNRGIGAATVSVKVLFSLYKEETETGTITYPEEAF